MAKLVATSVSDDVNVNRPYPIPVRSPLDLGVWVCLGWPDEDDFTSWMLRRHNLRLSAGVPLRTIRPNILISSHLGEILVLQRNESLSFVLLSSFIDGLRAVRQQFERELEEGRRAATTAEERVANLRKCRERMNTYSDQIVVQHLKVLPVAWKARVPKRLFRRFRCGTVLHSTTPDSRLVDWEEETNVAAVGYDWHIIIRVGKEGNIDAEWKRDYDCMMAMSPVGGSESCHTKAFGQIDVTGAVNMIQYVRDSDSKTGDIQMRELMSADCVGRLEMVQSGSSGGSVRWLVFVADETDGVTVYDTETGKMACLRPLMTRSYPSGAMQTSEGLWLWGGDEGGYDKWSKFFKVEALQSLDYKDPSIFKKPAERVRRRVVDESLDAEAFREATQCLGTIRKEGRHPGHYWVVAGYGPVPTSLRAPDHIYKEVETLEELERYQGDFPFWSAWHNRQPWLLVETTHAPWSPIWAGAVDVRDGVTAERIKEDPKTDAWRVGVPIESGLSGELSVTGNTLWVLSSSGWLEARVKAGRWLWRFHSDNGKLELTLRHESVSEVDVEKCTTPTVVDSEKFNWCLTDLNCLAPVIPEETLREKIAEFSELAYASECHLSKPLILLDKKVIDKETEWHSVANSEDKSRLIPLTGGLGLHPHKFTTLMVGDNVIRLRDDSLENLNTYFQGMARLMAGGRVAEIVRETAIALAPIDRSELEDEIGDQSSQADRVDDS